MLAFGAVAAPAASAAPIGDDGTQALVHNAPVVRTLPVSSHPIAPPVAYWRQEKQFISSRPSPSYTNTVAVAPSEMGQTGAAAAYLAAHRLQAPGQHRTTAASSSSTFDWGDAGIGAAGGLVIAIGVGGGLVLSHRRYRTTGTSAVVTG